MPKFSDDEIRQKEHVSFIFEELSILSFAEANMCFFGLTDAVKESPVYQKIQSKRSKLLARLARHVYILEKIRYNDYIDVFHNLDDDARERMDARDQDFFYNAFPPSEAFKVNDEIEREINIIESARLN